MLHPQTPFPQVGSFALFMDPARPPEQRVAELAQVLQTFDGGLLISLPLREDATGTRRCTVDELIDGTPLTADECRELVDLARRIDRRDGGSPRGLREARARHDVLQRRNMWSGALRRLLDRHHSKRVAA